MSENTANQDKPVRKPRAAKIIAPTPAIRTIVTFGVEGDFHSGIAQMPAKVATLAEQVKAAHDAAIAARQANSGKLPVPRRGDVVAEVDQNGQLVGTWTVARKPSSMTILRSDTTDRTWNVNSDNLRKTDEGIWTVTMPTFTVNWTKVFNK